MYIVRGWMKDLPPSNTLYYTRNGAEVGARCMIEDGCEKVEIFTQDWDHLKTYTSKE